MKTADIDVSLIDYMGTDLNVVNAARVSFHKESALIMNEKWEFTVDDKDAKLIRYLAKHKHFSPFNHAFISVRVKAPIFVSRQLVKHKFMPWNEVSRRYVDEEPEFYEMEGWRERADNVKQGSAESFVELEGRNPEGLVDPDWKFTGLMDLKDFIETTQNHVLHNYKALLAAGVCPEQARAILPQNMMTEWVWSGTLGAFADMLKLRLDPHTQYETRLVAEKIKAIVEPLFPVSLGALLENK